MSAIQCNRVAPADQTSRGEFPPACGDSRFTVVRAFLAVTEAWLFGHGPHVNKSLHVPS